MPVFCFVACSVKFALHEKMNVAPLFPVFCLSALQVEASFDLHFLPAQLITIPRICLTRSALRLQSCRYFTGRLPGAHYLFLRSYEGYKRLAFAKFYCNLRNKYFNSDVTEFLWFFLLFSFSPVLAPEITPSVINILVQYHTCTC